MASELCSSGKSLTPQDALLTSHQLRGPSRLAEPLDESVDHFLGNSSHAATLPLSATKIESVYPAGYEELW